MSKVYVVLLIVLLTGCSQVNNFLEYYNDENLDITEYIPLKEKENVEVIETMSLDERVKEYIDKGYIILGNSYFQAQWCPRALAVDTAKIKGASVVIISSRHIGDENRTYAIPYTQQHTTYHQGSVNTYSQTRGSISNSYSNLNFNATTNGYGSYSGTSTYYTTDYITNSYTVSYYEQIAVFLAKKNNN